MSDHPSHVIKKRTMIKDRVGCCRSSTYNLPAEGHIYGMKSPEQLEGAGNIISNWVTANPSLEKKSTKLIVASNVLAIKHGHLLLDGGRNLIIIIIYNFYDDNYHRIINSCITATAMRQYNLEHPNIRMKEALQSSSTRIDANHEGPFGIKSKFSEDPMDTILQGKFTNYNHEDRDYPSVQSIKKVGYLPDPRPTVASLAVIHAREKKEEEAKPKHFIMKKFQNIKGKMQTEREFAASQNIEEPASSYE